MVDLPGLQKRIYQNKLNQGSKVTDIFMEFCYMQGELSEAFHAYNEPLRRKRRSIMDYDTAPAGAKGEEGSAPRMRGIKPLRFINKKKPDLGEELADAAIYLLGLSEILGINLEEGILLKAAKNERRRYTQQDGVNIRISE